MSEVARLKQMLHAVTLVHDRRIDVAKKTHEENVELLRNGLKALKNAENTVQFYERYVRKCRNALNELTAQANCRADALQDGSGLLVAAMREHQEQVQRTQVARNQAHRLEVQAGESAQALQRAMMARDHIQETLTKKIKKLKSQRINQTEEAAIDDLASRKKPRFDDDDVENTLDDMP
jgi:hypothetical protein